MQLPPDVESTAQEALGFWSLMTSDKRIWIALAVAGFIGFVAGAVIL